MITHATPIAQKATHLTLTVPTCATNEEPKARMYTIQSDPHTLKSHVQVPQLVFPGLKLIHGLTICLEDGQN